MARWNRTITGYAGIREQYENDEIDAVEAGKRLAAVLNEQIGDVLALRFGEETPDGLMRDLSIDTIVLDLEAVEDVEDFDNILDSLYDWADSNRVWIE